jgi:hypothetical protein
MNFLLMGKTSLMDSIHRDARWGLFHVNHGDSSTQGLGPIPTWLMPQVDVQ